MRYVTFSSLVLFMALTPGPASGGLPRQAQGFLQDNCQRCHNGKVKKGDLDLANLGQDAAKPDSFGRWVQVFDRVQAGGVPPKSAGRPGGSGQDAVLRAR